MNTPQEELFANPAVRKVYDEQAPKHDEHVTTWINFQKTKILTVERAAEWLNFSTWKRHEAILIFSGYDPESHRFYDEDDAPLSTAQLLHQAFPKQEKASWAFFLDLINEKRIPLPLALAEALKIKKEQHGMHLSVSVEVLTSTQPMRESAGHAPVVDAEVPCPSLTEEELATEPATLPLAKVQRPFSASTGPAPVNTLQVAQAFEGLHGWNFERWKKNLGNKPKWLKACMATPGAQGVDQATWNPVLIGAELFRLGDKQNSIRARFMREGSPIAHWSEAWKDYEAVHL